MTINESSVFYFVKEGISENNGTNSLDGLRDLKMCIHILAGLSTDNSFLFNILITTSGFFNWLIPLFRYLSSPLNFIGLFCSVKTVDEFANLRLQKRGITCKSMLTK